MRGAARHGRQYGVSPDQPSLGPYVLPPLVIIPMGIVSVVAGLVLFPPLRGGAWLVGVGVGAGAAAGFGGVFALLPGTPARRFARKVLGVLSAPGLVALGLGAVLIANGVLDRSPPVSRDVAAKKVRRTNVDGDDEPNANTLVDVDDWESPGRTLTLRFEQPPPIVGGALRVTTRRGALGFEWRQGR